jgi:hypothetical protein
MVHAREGKPLPSGVKLRLLEGRFMVDLSLVGRVLPPASQFGFEELQHGT